MAPPLQPGLLSTPHQPSCPAPCRPPLSAQQGPGGGGVLFFTAGTVEEAAEAQPELDPLDALLAGLGTAGKDACGRTALHRAATEGDVDLIQALLVQADNPEGVQELVQAGDRDGQTPLHAAARCGQEAAVEALAAPPGRADVNAPDDAGWTPLHHGGAQGAGPARRAAECSGGGRLDAPSRRRAPPQHRRCQGAGGSRGAGAPHGVLLCSNCMPAVHLACVAGAQPEGFPSQAPLQVDMVDEFGQSPLHAAAAAGCVDVVEALLEARADPTLRAGRSEAAAGFSPLELAEALLAEQAESRRGPTVEARLCAALLRRAQVRGG